MTLYGGLNAANEARYVESFGAREKSACLNLYPTFEPPPVEIVAEPFSITSTSPNVDSSVHLELFWIALYHRGILLEKSGLNFCI